MNEVKSESGMANSNNDQQKKCINCMFFDPRTAFCRKSPPQVVVNAEGFYVAVFPKIAIPMLDFCFEHKPIIEKETLLG